jgi:hypothetical protein
MNAVQQEKALALLREAPSGLEPMDLAEKIFGERTYRIAALIAKLRKKGHVVLAIIVLGGTKNRRVSHYVLVERSPAQPFTIPKEVLM